VIAAAYKRDAIIRNRIYLNGVAYINIKKTVNPALINRPYKYRQYRTMWLTTMQQMTCSTYIQRKILNVALSLNSYFSLYSTWFHQYISLFLTVSRDALWCPFIPLDSTNISHNSRPSREMRYGVPLFHLIPPIHLTIPDRLARCVMWQVIYSLSHRQTNILSSVICKTS